MNRRLAQIVVSGGLSVAAGIHLAVAATHDIGTLHGAFFSAAGVVQLVLAVRTARWMSSADLIAAATSSLVLLAVWFVERLGPDVADGPGALDTLASASELVVAVAASSMLLVGLAGSTGRRWMARPGAVALAAVAASLSYVVAPAEHDHHHGPVAPAVPTADRSVSDQPQVERSPSVVAPVIPAFADPHVTGEFHEH